MDITMKATNRETILRVGGGALHITRDGEGRAVARAFGKGGTLLGSLRVDAKLLDMTTALATDAQRTF